MNLVIDFGNTFVKVGWFEQDQLIEARYKIPFEEIYDIMGQKAVEAAIFASTSHDTAPYAQWLQARGVKTFALTPDLPLPIGKDYDTPRTLGADRLAAAAGAVALFPAQNCLVIDMGTCVTYDWVSADGIFRGGIISPGLRMRFQAMHTFTKRLPLIEKHDFSATSPVPLLGKSTLSAMQSGGFNGLLAELEGFIIRYQHEYGDCQVLLCGGDAAFFESRLKSPIFAAPNLVLIGLNRILLHNVNL